MAFTRNFVVMRKVFDENCAGEEVWLESVIGVRDAKAFMSGEPNDMELATSSLEILEEGFDGVDSMEKLESIYGGPLWSAHVPRKHGYLCLGPEKQWVEGRKTGTRMTYCHNRHLLWRCSREAWNRRGWRTAPFQQSRQQYPP